MPKRINYWKVCVILIIAVVGGFLVWPTSIKLDSPDTNWSVRVSATNSITAFLFDGSMGVYLKNNLTGKEYLVERDGLGIGIEGKVPQEILWHPSSKRFAVISETLEMPHDVYTAYFIKAKSSQVLIEDRWSGADWVEEVLNKRRYAD